METPGLYIKSVIWTDPRFAPFNLENLGDFNAAQRNAFLDEDDDDDYGPDELTQEELIQACKQSECRIDLSRANVCKGVERSWPKRIFGEMSKDFDQLIPEQHQIIYRRMEKKAIFLYTEYVDEAKMARRRARSLKNAHAHIYEQRYRRNLYNRIKALGEPNASHSQSIDNTQDSLMSGVSMETVINTGKMHSSESQSSTNQTDENDNEWANVNGDIDDDIDYLDFAENDENDANIENANVITTFTDQRKLPKRSVTANRKSLSVIVQKTTVMKTVQSVTIAGMSQQSDNELVYAISDEETDRMNDLFTESESGFPTQPSQANNTQNRSDERFVCVTPSIRCDRPSEYRTETPSLDALQNNIQWLTDENTSDDGSDDADGETELDFLSQEMELRARTSTQK